MSKPWKPSKKTVALEPAQRPSRIRRDPIRTAGDDAKKRVYWSDEWEIRFGVTGITIFAVVIFIVILGFAAITEQWSRDDAPQVQRFGSCDVEGGANCVIDGASFRYGGERVAIAGLVAPSVLAPRCPDEQRLGAKAEARLIELLNGGQVTLGGWARASDGSWARSVSVDGQDVGQAMISAGLARKDDGTKAGWC